MNIKPCSKCNKQPKMESDELGATYRLICNECYRYTQDILSKNCLLDEEVISRLTEEWNNMN